MQPFLCFGTLNKKTGCYQPSKEDILLNFSFRYRKMDNPEDVHFSKPIHFPENGYFFEPFFMVLNLLLSIKIYNTIVIIN